MDEQSTRRDLISDLPLGIIHIILSFVPIRDAIRTSLLSKQWRYIWTSLPHLAFDDKCVNPPMESESDKKRLSHFISQSLLLHKGPVHEFQIRLRSLRDFQCDDQWLLFLSKNGIRILILELNEIEPGIEVHSSLYSCQNLTHLTLHVNTFPPPPPAFKGFLFLRSLYIRSSTMDPSTIERIVAHSPLLETVKISSPCSEMAISAPNLKSFCFSFRFTLISLCAPLLEELTVFFSFIRRSSFHSSSVFPHLRIIKLWNLRFNRTEATMAVDNIIKHSPNLQKIKICTLPSWIDDAPELARVSFWDTESAPNLTCDSLKVIKMTVNGCGINEMKLIKFLLARSPMLERMKYTPGESLSEQELLNLKAELRGCRRASANAEIVIDESLLTDLTD